MKADVTAIEVRTDQKAGYCGRCRQGNHALCASPVGRCACAGHDHPNRPSARLQEASVPATARQIAAVPEPLVRWEDPPEPNQRGAKPIRFAPELLAELEANPGKWARVEDFKAKSTASGRVKAFKAGKFAPVAPPPLGRRGPSRAHRFGVLAAVRGA